MTAHKSKRNLIAGSVGLGILTFSSIESAWGLAFAWSFALPSSGDVPYVANSENPTCAEAVEVS